ncbi:hypothetical protein K488DRAFT_84256 [Vararia minispora EC-137]|uniref:Uncharacterized protein n=1 Tax=Vararia minispora EC-137 TaxID=1314806 RepID=A0ACB8QR58_9AGAM|nr:hypothetical protein K488DRAFT_84256 [Vararia minispora EC-137]
MPPRRVVPSSNRAWGTRFDSLHSVTSSPPLADPNAPPTDHMTPISLKPGPTLNPIDSQRPPSTPAKSADGPSNDASIFMDPADLSRRLSDHLSAYIDVKQVKVIRDNRGGVCAFVRCRDPATAAQFIQDVKARSLEPFMGRNLRFEHARSSRKLLFSYRQAHIAPMRIVDESGATESLEPATVMRLHKPQGSRFVTIHYNAEALQPPSPCSSSDDEDTSKGVLEGQGMLLSPLRYDGETLAKIVSAFGPIEHFGVYSPPAGDDGELPPLPPQHAGPRSEGMEAGCWEVKWEHRDDCMAALMSLRHVPHLSVSWAHLAGARAGGSGPHLASPFTPSTRPRMGGHPAEWASPLHFEHKLARTLPARFAVHHPPTTSNSTRSSDIEPDTAAATYGSGSSTRLVSRTGSTLNNGDHRDAPRSAQAGNDWAEVASHPASQILAATPGSPNIGRSPITPRSTVSALPNGSPVRVTVSVREADAASASASWHEDEKAAHADRGFGEAAAASQGVTPIGDPHGKHCTHAGAPLSAAPPLSILTHSLQPMPTIPPATRSLYMDNTSGVQPGPPMSYPLDAAFRALSMTHGETLDDPALLTPETNVELITPVSPHVAVYQPQVVHDGDGDMVEESIQTELAKQGQGQKHLDHTTIFIGGMEMYGPNAWDEARVRAVFEQFGYIEGIKFIRPNHKKSAFAFVRYRDVQSSSRAVMVEHNKIYAGRQLRVQIRENNPQKPFFMFPPGERERLSGRQAGARASRTSVYEVGKLQRRWPSNTRRSIDHSSMLSRNGATEPSSDGMLSSASPAASFASTYPATTATQTPEPTSVPVSQAMPPSTTVFTPYHAPVQPVQTSAIAPQPSVHPPPPQHPGYFMPQPWMMHPYPYPMPFAPYPGYVFPSPQRTHGQEGSHSPAFPAGYQPPAFYPYPYPMIAPVIPAVDQHPPQQTQRVQGAETPSRQAPPLVPTSFVQGEHGLMPVYAPEALDQYMSRANGGQPVATDRAIAPTPPAAPIPSPAGPWHGYGYAYPHASSSVRVPAGAGASAAPPSPAVWYGQHMPYGVPPVVTPQPVSHPFFAAVPAPKQRLAGSMREHYAADLTIPVIGAGPLPAPARHRRDTSLMHKKGAASMEEVAIAAESGNSGGSGRAAPIVTSKSSPRISRA